MKRLFILDDNPAILSGLSMALGDKYEVRTDTDVFRAIKELSREHHDVLVLDLLMPGLDGVGFLRALREKGIDVPVLLMSASRNLELYAQGLDIAGYLKKPFELEDLEAKIEAVLAGT